MQTIKWRLKLTMIEPLLGTASGNSKLHEEFIAAKAATAEELAQELAALPAAEQIERASTVFPKVDGGLVLWDYQVKGMLKENIGLLTELGEASALTKWTYKKVVNLCLFVYPRAITLRKPDGSPWLAAPTHNQRPLRAETMQGDRVALARSEELPAGTWLECEAELLLSHNAKSKTASLTDTVVEAALAYGKRHGLGQWRNAGFGRFTFEIVSKE